MASGSVKIRGRGAGGIAPQREENAGVAPANTKWIILGLSVAGVLLLAGIIYLANVLTNPRMSLIPAPAVKNVQAGAPVYSFSVYGRQELPFRRPLAVGESPNGDVYVVDTGNSLVQIFDHNGRFKGTIGKPGGDKASAGEFAYPIGIAFDDAGRAFVTDSRAGHISVFAPNGSFLGYFAEWEGGKAVEIPGGISYMNGKFYVPDLASHKIVVLNYNGDKLQEIGTGRGEDQAQLQYPNYVWAGSDGRIYVADSNNNRVVIFSPEGEVMRSFTGGESGSPLNLPRGISIDGLGLIHVVSVFSHQVEVFNGDGTLAYKYGERGERDGEFNFPNGIFVSGKRVYVADRENNRVQVWEY